jgi:hypothetical protein
MKPLSPHEILNLCEYERVREARRRAVIDLKRIRRVQVGRYLSLVFENRETVRFQIQEMCRAERIADDTKVAEEVEVYNTLLPASGELAATVLIEIEDSAQIKPVLDRLLGIDRRDYVRLEVGPRVVLGRFEAGHSDERRARSVRCISCASPFGPMPGGTSSGWRWLSSWPIPTNMPGRFSC